MPIWLLQHPSNMWNTLFNILFRKSRNYAVRSANTRVLGIAHLVISAPPEHGGYLILSAYLQNLTFLYDAKEK